MLGCGSGQGQPMDLVPEGGRPQARRSKPPATGVLTPPEPTTAARRHSSLTAGNRPQPGHPGLPCSTRPWGNAVEGTGNVPGPKGIREPEPLPHSQGVVEPTPGAAGWWGSWGQGGGWAWCQHLDLTQPPHISTLLTLGCYHCPRIYFTPRQLRIEPPGGTVPGGKEGVGQAKRGESHWHTEPSHGAQSC